MKRVLAAVLLLGLVLAGILAFRARKPAPQAVARGAALAPPVPEPAALVALKTQAPPEDLRRGAVEIVGRVHDLTGGPVPGATVTVTMQNEASKVGSVSTTDAAGAFHAWVDEGEITAVATADGYTSAARNGVVPGARLELVLAPESVLEGVVVEAGTETPVAGALVTAEAQDGDVSSRAVSGADGRFRIRALGPGHYKPEAVTPNRWGTARASVLLGLAESVRDVRIEVHPSFSVSGRVLRGDAGCAGASVILSGRTFLDTRMAIASAGGDVQLEGLFPDTYEVTASCPEALEREDGRLPDVVVTDADVAGLAWTFDAGFTLRGTVLDERGGGVAGVRVLAREKSGHAGEAVAEADGTFTMRGLAAGSYELSALRREVFSDEALATMLVAHDVEGIRLTLPPGGMLRGSVVDDHGAPVAGVTVHASTMPVDEEDAIGNPRAVDGVTMTGEDGTFALADLRPLRYGVRVDRQGLRLRRTGATPLAPVVADIVKGRTTTLRIVVEGERGSLHGRVVDAQGNPVENVFVEAERRGDEAEQDDAHRTFDRSDFGSREPVLVDAEGRFTIRKLGEGRYAVRAFRKGGGDAIAQDVALGSEVVLTMKDDASIGGVVVGAGDRFVVTASSEDEHRARTESFFRTGGAFTLRDLPPGTSDIAVESSAGIGTLKVVLVPGERREDLRVELRAYGKARGVVVGPDGKPVTGATVVATPKQGEPGSGQMSVQTDAAGHFELERLSAGKTVIHLLSVLGRHRSEIDVASGNTVDLGTVRLEKETPAEEMNDE